jgi:hypothetical protein
MKSEARLFTILSTILLLCIPSQPFIAQGSLLMTDLEPLMARLDAGIVKDNPLSQESFRNSFNLYHEADIELENWMLDTGSWSDRQHSLKYMDFLSREKEQELVLEKWMTMPVISGDRLFNRYLKEEKEDSIKLEYWMLSREAWTRN